MTLRIGQIIVFSGLLAAGAAEAQTCNARIEATAPTARYVIHGDGTVTDVRTSLRWQRCPLGYTVDDGGTALDYSDDRCLATGTTTYDWQGALQAAESQNGSGGFAGFTDWRVPNIKELVSTVEYSCASPAVNAEVFPDTPVAGRFWSSTTYNNLFEAAVLAVEQGFNSTAFKRGAGSLQYVRLVR